MHGNIIVGYSQYFCFVLQYLSGGELFDYIVAKEKLSVCITSCIPSYIVNDISLQSRSFKSLIMIEFADYF